MSITAENPRRGNKPRSSYDPAYIEKFAVTLGLTKVNVSNIHETTRQINSIQFDVSELNEEEQRILDTPKACAGREQLLIYNEYINQQIHEIFDPYKTTPIAISLDTGSHKHRQKENMFDTVYYWNIEFELLTKQCKNIGCKYMTFTYRCSIGKFDKDHKKSYVYAEYIVADIRKSGMCNVDLLIADGEPALQAAVKDIRHAKYAAFRLKYLVPILMQSIADALHNVDNAFKLTAKV